MIERKAKIAAIVGPTACGKTTLSIDVARHVGGEIICCDSMQVYRDMTVGTAAPTELEKSEVPHHLFGVVDPHLNFSASDYAAAAEPIIRDVIARGKLPILVGGTGLYLDSLILGCGDSSAAPDEDFRREMEKFAAENGAIALHALLCEKDPEAAEKIHPNNVKRVIRALEICRFGDTKSDYDKRSRVDMRYDARVAGIFFPDRDLLYRRIERRIDKMIENGLVDEAKTLEKAGVFDDLNGTAAQAIGYKEILPYIHGDEPLSLSIERLKTATRHYAKRQITWFSAKSYITRFDFAETSDAARYAELVDGVSGLFQK